VYGKIETRKIIMKTFGSWLLEEFAKHNFALACGITSDQVSRIISEVSPFNLPVDSVFEKSESLLPNPEQIVDLFKSHADIT
jgi:hypothetical protein